MLKASTGSSVNSDARSAGREAAEKIRRHLEKPTVIFAYASSEYYGNFAEMLAGINEIFPGAPVIGHTSWHGVVLPEGLISGRYFLGLMALADPDLTVGVASAVNQTNDAEGAMAAGREMALAAMAKAGRKNAPDSFYMTALPGFEEFYLKGITEVIGRKPMFGGSAIDNQVTGDWDVYTDEGVVGYGAAVSFFYDGRLPVTHFTSNPYYETEEKILILKMRTPRKLVTVSGEPLIDRIADRTGCSREFLTGGDIQMATILEPIGVKDVLGTLTSLRLPMSFSADGTFDFGSNLAEGTAGIHMKATVSDLVASGAQELNWLADIMEQPAGAYHLSMNYGRGMMMRDEGMLTEAVRLICNAAGHVPFIMPFTLAEYGFVEDGRNTCGNLMLSFAGFPE